MGLIVSASVLAASREPMVPPRNLTEPALNWSLWLQMRPILDAVFRENGRIAFASHWQKMRRIAISLTFGWLKPQMPTEFTRQSSKLSRMWSPRWIPLPKGRGTRMAFARWTPKTKPLNSKGSLYEKMTPGLSMIFGFDQAQDPRSKLLCLALIMSSKLIENIQ